MKHRIWALWSMLAFYLAPQLSYGQPIIIAHRGASGYLPEHTLEAVVMAHALEADYIEQDIILSKDDVPMVIHDPYLEQTTNVKRVFPKRMQKDGHYHVMDFSLKELKQLQVVPRRSRTAKGLQYPNRFPQTKLAFRIPTLEEEIQLIQGLNRSTKRDVGLYVELKYPSLHERQGKDVVGQTLKVLSRFGYSKLTDKAFVQCFESAPLKRIRKQKLSNLRLTQLIGDNRWGIGADDYDVMQTEDGLKSVATYAHGVGPWLGHIVKETTSGGQRNITTTPLVTWAQEAGLVVHPYTFRRDSLPKGFTSFDKLIDLFVNKLKVNGLITDHPDLRSLISKR